MPEMGDPGTRDRRDLLRAVRERLRDLDDSLRPLAEGLLAEASRIDLLACDGEGRAVAFVVAERGEDDRALTRALAQLAWIDARVRDWLKLAPALGLAPDASARCWILCPDFDPETLCAVRSLPVSQVALARCLWRTRPDGLDLWLEPVWPGAPAPTRAPAVALAAAPETAAAPRSAVFRSGLRDDDFQLTAAERRAFGQAGSRRDPTG